MIHYPLMACIAAFSTVNAVNEAAVLPQKTIATVFTLNAGTAREQAIDLKNQFDATERSIRSIMKASWVSVNTSVMLIAGSFEMYRHSWIEPCLDDVLAAAKANPKDPEVASALIFFVSRSAPLVEAQCSYQQAQRILMEHHVAHPAIGEVAKQLGHSWHDKQGIALLSKIHQTHTDEAVRKIAQASLARVYKDRAEWAKWHKKFGNNNAENIAFSNSATFIAAFKELDETDPESLIAESRKYQ